MPADPSLRAWLALSLIQGLGGEGARKLLKTFGSPEAIFSASSSSLLPFVKPSIASELANGIDDAVVNPAFDWLEDTHNHIVTLADSDYPQPLLNIPDPPLLLYVKGRIDLLNKISLAIVGSRHATPQGMANATSFSQSISEIGLCVISGMAHGIDAAAHREALLHQGSSIAIVGTGLDRIYPSSNRDLAHALAISGALISEFPLGMPPLAANFPRRNRIISGMSVGCLVVEASLQSGSLITARLALEQGREVFAIPGSIHSPQSKGCHRLIKQGAKLVESAQDILEELGHIVPMNDGSLGSQLIANCTCANPELTLLDHLGFDPVDIDALLIRSGLTMTELSAMLLALELDGIIAVQPGGLYQRIH